MKATSLNSLKINKKSPINEYSVQAYCARQQVLEYFLHIPNCVLFDVNYLKYFGLKVLLAHTESRRLLVKDVLCRAQEDTWRYKTCLFGTRTPYKANKLTFTTVNNLTGIFFSFLWEVEEREKGEGGAIIPIRVIREYGVLVRVKFLFVTKVLIGYH